MKPFFHATFQIFFFALLASFLFEMTTILAYLHVPSKIVSVADMIRIGRSHNSHHKSLYRFSFALMSTKSTATNTTSKKRIAICGSGVTGSIAANLLANCGQFEVHTFEQGRGPGGRSSTRRVSRLNRIDSSKPVSSKSLDSSNPLLFDHGAQYIKEPKTAEFKSLLDGWLDAGVVAEWKGIFGECSPAQGGRVNVLQQEARRYVGVPQMNSICKHMLHAADGVVSHFQTRVNATLSVNSSGAPCWQVIDTNDPSCAILGEFDWLIATDRSMASKAIWRPPSASPADVTSRVNELYEQLAADHRQVVGSVLNVPSVVLMVSLPKQLPKSVFPFDSVTFTSDRSNTSSAGVEATRAARRQQSKLTDGSSIIGWISRDSSKPQRYVVFNFELVTLEKVIFHYDFDLT